MRELQKTFHIYKAGVYEGTMVATDAELAASSYTSGAAPDGDYVLKTERGGMVVSRFQAKAALLNANMLSKVEDLVASLSDPFIQLAWNEAVEFQRDSPTILALQSALELSNTELDALFKAASRIKA